jgi:ribonuclease P protein subunit POP4
MLSKTKHVLVNLCEKDEKEAEAKVRMKYGINEKNVLGHELIGLKAKVIKSVDLKKQGLQGTIRMESMNMLSLKTREGIKLIPKKEALLEVLLPDEKRVLVDGRKLVARHEDRTKNWFRKYREEF